MSPPLPPRPRRRVWDCLYEDEGDDVDTINCHSESSSRPLEIESSQTATTKSDQDTDTMAAATASATTAANTTTRRRRIWDDYDVNVGENNNPPAPPPPNTTPTNPSAAATTIHARIVGMKKELSSKSRQLRQLQCDLVQAKLANRQRLEELQSSLDERRREQQSRHDEAMGSQKQLLTTIRTDCAAMKDRAEVISGEIHQVMESRQRLCRTLEMSGRRELQKKQREWESADRRRLARLLSERTEAMKQDAAKSLEPELSRILKQNKREKQALREQLTRETADLRSRLEAENEVRAEKEMEAIRKEMEAKGREMEDGLEQRLARMSLQHSDEIERIRGASTGHLCGDATIEAALTRREDEHMKALEAVRTQESRDINAMTERHQRTMVDLRERHGETLEVERTRVHSSLDEWKVQRGKQLEEESKSLERQEISNLRRKVDGDIARVECKLQDEAKQKKKGLQEEADSRISVVENTLMLEMRSAQRDNDTARSQAQNAKEERTVLGKEIDDIEARISTAKTELAEAEKAAEEAKMNAEKIEAQTSRDVQSAREMAKAAIDEAKMKLSSLESTLRTRQEEAKENVDRRTKIEEDQKAQCIVEVDMAKKRIADLVKRKEAKVEAATALLQEKTNQSKSLEKSIEEARKL